MRVKVISIICVILLKVSTGHGQSRYSDLLNLDLFNQMMIQEINSLRMEKGYDTLIVSEQLKEVARIEAEYCAETGESVNDPNFVTNMKRVLGEDVYSSANTNLAAHWFLDRFDSWSNVEKRMAEGYLLGVKQDGMTHSLLKNYKDSDPCYKGYIGVNSVIENDTVFMSLVIYFTCSSIY